MGSLYLQRGVDPGVMFVSPYELTSLSVFNPPRWFFVGPALHGLPSKVTPGGERDALQDAPALYSQQPCLSSMYSRDKEATRYEGSSGSAGRGLLLACLGTRRRGDCRG